MKKNKKYKGDVEWMGQQEMTHDDMPQMEVLRSDLSELQKLQMVPDGTPLVHWMAGAPRAH